MDNANAGEMADEKGDNIMHVELAIQRELAYRRKVAMLQLQPDGDFCKDHIPLQVQSSSLTLSQSPSPRPNSNPIPRVSGVKQQAPTSSFECLPPQELAFCKVCQVCCSSAFSYKQHVNGQKHKAKLLQLKCGRNDGGRDVCDIADQQRWCKLCKIWCMNANFKQHVEGQNHKNEIIKLEHARKGGGKITNERKWCELCHIGCMNEDSLQQHLDGKKHKAELQKTEYTRMGIEAIAKQQKWCKLCNVWCTDEDSLKRHLKGKKHVLQLHDIEDKKRPSGSCDGKARLKRKKVEEDCEGAAQQLIIDRNLCL